MVINNIKHLSKEELQKRKQELLKQEKEMTEKLRKIKDELNDIEIEEERRGIEVDNGDNKEVQEELKELQSSITKGKRKLNNEELDEREQKRQKRIQKQIEKAVEEANKEGENEKNVQGNKDDGKGKQNLLIWELVKKYQKAQEKENEAKERNRQAIRKWYIYAKEFQRILKERKEEIGMTEQTARKLIYNEMLKELKENEEINEKKLRENLKERTRRAERIMENYNIIGEERMNKINLSTTTFSKLTEEQAFKVRDNIIIKEDGEEIETRNEDGNNDQEMEDIEIDGESNNTVLGRISGYVMK